MALTRPRYSNFVDNDFKNSCRVVTTTNIALSSGAPSTYDGVALALNDRVLVTAQESGNQNGIYVVNVLGTGSNGTWTRSFDANDGSRLSAGAVLTISEGTYAAQQWRLTTPDPITIGSTALTFIAGAASAGGTTSQIQFNNSGSLQGVGTLTYVSGNTSVVSSGNIFAATLYTDQLRWAANSAAITLTGNVNPAVYIGNTAIGTSTVLVDSVVASGNTMIIWTTLSQDTVNSRYKKSTIDSFNNGSTVTFAETSIKSDPTYSVATFTSNIAGGLIKLWATGDSASVIVTYERRVLGSSTPLGYINNFGPIGPAGTISGTSSDIVTTSSTDATSTSTGALRIAGGAGITGNLYTGGNVVVGANLTVLGNLIVQGNVTTLNTTELAIEDLNITVAKGAGSAAAANGAGITIDGANATFNYVASTDAWTSNKNIYSSAFFTGGDIKWSGNNAVYRSGINYTPSDVPPINSNFGDQWYDTTTDILYEWQTSDGATGFWIDIGSLALLANANLASASYNSITANAMTSAGNITAGNVVLGGVDSGYVYANNFIFSTNGASIFDSFGVNSYGNVNVAQYLPKYTGNLQAANVYVVGNDSTSISTGALRVVGGAGINGNLFVDGSGSEKGGIAVTGNRGQVTIGNDTRDGSAQYILNTNTGLYSGVQVKRTGADLWYYGADQSERYIVRYSSNTDRLVIDTTGNVVIVAATSSTSTTTGALVVKGGAGIAGDVNIGTSLTVDNSNYGNVTTTQFGSLFAYAYGPNNYSIIQAWSQGTQGLGMNALGTQLYSSGAIVLRTGATLRDKDFPTGGVLTVQIAANGAIINGTGITSTSSGTGTVIVTGGVGVTGNINLTYAPVSPIGSALNLTGKDTQGGTGYFDFLKTTNTTSGATNPNKTFRLSSTGGLEIINSAYSTALLNLSDAGTLNVLGPIQIGSKKAVNGPAFSAYAEATLQTITSGSQQKVLFQTEEFDTDGCYSSSRFTPNVEGYYQLNAEVRLDGSSGTGEIMIVLYKNTSEHKRGTNQSGTSIATNFFAMQVSALVYANGTTDYFEIKVQQTSGSSMSVTAVNNPAITWFNGAMVRGA